MSRRASPVHPGRRRPICPGAESCKGKHVTQRLQGPGAGELGSAGVQGTSPSHLPHGHLPGPWGDLAGSPLLPRGRQEVERVKVQGEKTDESQRMFESSKTPVRSERGTRPSADGCRGATILGPRASPPGKNSQTPPPSSPVFLSPALSLF